MTLLPLVAPPQLVGRDSEIDTLVGRVKGALALGRPLGISAVHGMAGVGKTAVARAVAARVKDWFPDARVEVDLYGFTPGASPAEPRAVLAELLGWAGFEVASIPESLDGRSRLWRGWLAARRVLLLLDNVRTVEQVMPLLPQSAPRCLTLVTSRSSLDEMDAAVPLSLNTLAPADAIELLRLRARRPLDADDVLKEVARLCGLLPLALDPVGRLLARQEPALLAEALDDAMREGGHRFRDLPKIDQSVLAAFIVSYEALDEGQRRVLRCCVWHPGPDFDALTIAALAGLPVATAGLRLDELAQQSMLTRAANHRFSFHDVFLECARHRAVTEDPPEAQRAGRERLYAFLHSQVRAATRMLNYASPGDPHYILPAQARAWLTASTSELQTVAHAALEDWPDAFGLGAATAWWLRFDGRYLQARDLYSAMYTSALLRQDAVGRASAVKGLGHVAWQRNEYGRAEEAYEQARVLYEEIRDRKGQADSLHGLGVVARMTGGGKRAEGLLEQARFLYEEIGDCEGQANTLAALGGVARLRGEYGRAEKAYEQARVLYEKGGHRRGQAHALRGLGDVSRGRGDYGRAEEVVEQAGILYEEAGDRLGQADVLLRMGDVARERGDYGRAEKVLEQARVLYEGIGDWVGQANALRNLGDVARERGDYGRAEKTLEQARVLYEDIGYRVGQANALRGLGDVARERGDFRRAEEAYEHACAIYEESGYRLGHANALQGLGAVARVREEFAQAERALEQARTLYAEIGDRVGQAEVAVGMARLANAQGNKKDAYRAYGEALAIYQNLRLTYWADLCRAEREQSQKG
ncbi:tetratricopeptide repeat protein [Nonomuraea sp. NPDC048826]|uniref:tetratricopeptide repeat protein n=1 Tax=Nonomuraea sp. NPDC048826 TaxID=3364347 RepID=UPI003713C082